MKPELEAAREALAALPDDAAHALDPEPGPAPAELPPGVPPPPPFVLPEHLAGKPDAALRAAQDAALAGGLSPQDANAAGRAAAEYVLAHGTSPETAHKRELLRGTEAGLPPEEVVRLAREAGDRAVAAREAARTPQAPGPAPYAVPLPEPTPPPAIPLPDFPPAVPEQPSPFVLPLPEPPAAGVTAPQAPGAVPPVGPQPTPFTLPLPLPETPHAAAESGGGTVPVAEPAPEFELPPFAWPVLGVEDLAEPPALTVPEGVGSGSAAQPPFTWPVLGDTDLAGEPFGRPELPESEGGPGTAGRRGPDPFEGLFHPARPDVDFPDAGFGAPEAAGGGGGDLMGLLTRIAEGVEKLIEVMGQAQEQGGASFGGRPGRPGPGDDFGYDDDPETPASPSEDLEALFRPGKTQDAFGHPEPEAPKRQRRAAAEEL